MPQDKLEQALLSRKPVETINGTIVPPRLPDFEPDPIMPANREHAKEVYRYLRQNPNMKSLTPKITSGPTAATIRLMQHSKLPIDAFEGTNLHGVYDKKTKEIGLNPTLTKFDLWEAIAHEFGHADGLGEGAADVTGFLYARKLLDKLFPQPKNAKYISPEEAYLRSKGIVK